MDKPFLDIEDLLTEGYVTIYCVCGNVFPLNHREEINVCRKCGRKYRVKIPLEEVKIEEIEGERE